LISRCFSANSSSFIGHSNRGDHGRAAASLPEPASRDAPRKRIFPGGKAIDPLAAAAPPRRQSAWPTDPRIAGAPLPADVLVAVFAEIDFGTHEPRQACKT
jgi:hypothetical protein